MYHYVSMSMQPFCFSSFTDPFILPSFIPVPSIHSSIHPCIHPCIPPLTIHQCIITPSIHSYLCMHLSLYACINNVLVIIIPPPTLCIGAPVLHYVMGGGWELCTQSVIVKRIRDNRYRGGRLVTLPYPVSYTHLTLPTKRIV